MKKFILLFFFICSIVAAQVPIVPMLFQVDETTGLITPINSAWKIPYSNLTIDKNDIGLDSVVNRRQIKKLSSSTVNKIPAWATTSGDSLTDGYTVGTAANNIVQLDGSGKLPAVDGSQITGLAPVALGVAYLTADFSTNSTAAYVDITGLSKAVTENKKYVLSLYIYCNNSNIRYYNVNMPAGSKITGTVMQFFDYTSPLVPEKLLAEYSTTNDFAVLSGDNRDVVIQANFIIETVASGNIKIQMKSGSGTAYIRKGTHFILVEGY